MKNLIYTLAFTTSLLAGQALAQQAPLQGLLENVQQINAADSALNQQREAQFKADLSQQQSLLQRSRERLHKAESEQNQLKSQFDANDAKLAELEALLQQRSGQLGEVFGVAKQVAQELSPMLSDSLTSADHKGREAALAFAHSKRVPELQNLHSLWYQLQLEMTALGEIKQFQGQVVNRAGQHEQVELMRVGPFAAITADGRFLNWGVQQQQLTVLSTQPAPAEQQAAAAFFNAEDNELLLDPSRGQLFLLLGRMPKLLERIQQGGEVGYFIVFIGVLGLLIAAWQVLVLTLTEQKVRRQVAKPTQLSAANPLGRVLLAVSHSKLGLDQLELKVDEVILQEVPRLERGQSIIKLFAAVAPLLGLLGTVVGMIATFQSITLFGTGDPKLMAGGISQALMTTVMGLVAAIPLLFSHSYLTGRSRRITQILQEKSLGILADKSLSAKEEAAHVA